MKQFKPTLTKRTEGDLLYCGHCAEAMMNYFTLENDPKLNGMRVCMHCYVNNYAEREGVINVERKQDS